MNDTEKVKGVRTSVYFNPQIQEMVERLIAEKGYDTVAEVVKAGIRMLHTKEFPAYVETRRNTKTPEEKKQDKAKSEEEFQMSICERLGGEIQTNEGGNKVCVYFTYDRNNRYEQKLPLSHLTEDLLASQYSPSKEDVERRQKEGKVNY